MTDSNVNLFDALAQDIETNDSESTSVQLMELADDELPDDNDDDD